MTFKAAKDSTSRNRLEMTVRRLPKNATLVGEIKQFLPIPEGSPIQSGLVELMNGTILSAIDSVIFATGYRYSFPFLSQYYDGSTYVPHEGSTLTLSSFLPLDGSHIRDLYLDLFYIRDPTLAFIGVTLQTPTFPFSDYTTLALAKVWTSTAKLPSSQTMRALHEKSVEERGGYGKNALYLVRITYLIGWLNEAAVNYGGKQIDGIPESAFGVGRYWQIARFREPSQVRDTAVLASLGLVPMSGVDQEMNDDIPIYYDDDWLGGATTRTSRL
ncbi:hypothetical protein J3R82DRAFT_8420 [Butyriboletus roseoflavus]|nr:hypothetical protein J3R82DRAFT_8420 [Butyriboletus roseoflavus]